MAKNQSKPALAARAWRSLFDFFIHTRWQRDRVFRELDLTPNDGKALGSLHQREGKSMGALAEEWGTDASNVTWVVDRLERRGLVERRAVAGDRRVKLIGLTPGGVKTKTRMLEGMYEVPPEMLELTSSQLQTLLEVVEKLESLARERRPERRGD